MAPPAEPPATISLRIKVPPGTIPGGADEFTLGGDIPIASRIGHIRERIQHAVASHPTPERQRLLYGGRALVDNEQTVADALNVRRDPTQTEYVVHLLVKGDTDTHNTAPTQNVHGINAAPLSATQGTASPAPGDLPAQQPQQQPQPIPHIPHIHRISQQQMQQHQAAVFAQQQRLQMQMMHNANFNRFIPPAGMMPFGAQPMNLGPPPTIPIPGHQPQTAPFPQSNHVASDAAPQSAPPHDTLPAAANNIPGQPQTIPESSGRQWWQPPSGQPRQPLNHGFHIEGIGPNGERITMHQQTVNFQQHGFGMAPDPNAQYTPASANTQRAGDLGLPSFPGMPPQPQARYTGPTALEQARRSLAEIRHVLDDMRNTPSITEAQLARLENVQQRARTLTEYIDPLGLDTDSPGHLGHDRTRTASPLSAAHTGTPSPQTPSERWQQRATRLRQAQQLSPNATASARSSDITCYLMSSPNGPQAILYTPQHGTFTGSITAQQAHAVSIGPRPTPTSPVPPGTNETQLPGQAGQVEAAQPAQAAAAPQDPPGPLAPVVNNLWLLIRVLIFSYFLLGANLGWRRPLALLAIGLGFWMIRVGLLAEGAAVRRWWDGIMNDNAQGQRNAQDEAQQQQQGEMPAHGDAQNQQPQPRPGIMPTPDQVAQRLLNEDARLRNERFQWLRERIRPVERAVALLVASLWPGVGEAYVRAREQEERRRAEEEIAARRREEEELQRKEEEEKQEGAGGDKSSEIKDLAPAADSGTAHEEMASDPTNGDLSAGLESSSLDGA